MTQGLSHGNVVSEKPGSENYEALEQDTGADEIDDEVVQTILLISTTTMKEGCY